MATTDLPDTWHARDLPLLVELVRQRDTDPSGRTSAATAGDAIGMDAADQERALHALRAGGYVVDRPGPRRMVDGPLTTPLDFTSDALRAVQMWPTPESALERIVAALDDIAQNTDDDDTRTKADRFAAWLRSSATTVGLGVATAAVTGQLPGH